LSKEGKSEAPVARVIRTDFDLKDYFEEIKRRENLPVTPKEVPETEPSNPYAVEPETKPSATASVLELLRKNVPLPKTSEPAKENPIPTLRNNRKLVDLNNTPAAAKTPELTPEQKIYARRLNQRRNRGNTS